MWEQLGLHTYCSEDFHNPLMFFFFSEEYLLFCYFSTFFSFLLCSNWTEHTSSIWVCISLVSIEQNNWNDGIEIISFIQEVFDNFFPFMYIRHIEPTFVLKFFLEVWFVLRACHKCKMQPCLAMLLFSSMLSIRTQYL